MKGFVIIGVFVVAALLCYGALQVSDYLMGDPRLKARPQKPPEPQDESSQTKETTDAD